jgi:hypothetical protein
MTEVQVGGEMVPLLKNAPRSSNSGIIARIDLSYEVDSGTRYFQTRFRTNVAVDPLESVSEECGATMEESLRHVGGTIEQNPASTIGDQQ